jgi:protein phosphatase
MFVCPQCSSQNPTDHRFCQQCGFQLVLRLAVVEEHNNITGEPTDPQLDEPDTGIPLPPSLDDAGRYRIITSYPPEVTLDTRLVQVLDALPKQLSPIQEFITQQPPVDSQAYLGKLPSEYPEWDLWESCGVSQIARPYLALNPALKNIPQLCDTWADHQRTVVVLANHHQYVRLDDACEQAQPAELQAWFEEMLQLWGYLAPWSVQSSLLQLDNLYINADRQIYLRYLVADLPENPPGLDSLVKIWQKLSKSQNPVWQQAVEQLAVDDNLAVENLRQGLLRLAASAPTVVEPVVSTAQIHGLLHLEAAAFTDVGRQRDHNEDYYSIDTFFKQIQSPHESYLEGRGLYILCDGMGGHAAGEVASKMTIDKLKEFWQTHWQDVLPSEEEIIEAIYFANQALFEVNQSNASAGSGRMGTTLVMVMVQDDQVAIAHVGDSRCYLLEKSSSLVQITLDHEVGQREILRGVEPDIAYGRPDAYQLTQAIGPRDREMIFPDVQIFSLREDTLILVASDGLTDRDLVEEHGEALIRPLINQQVSLGQGVAQLVQFANGYNGHDNITAIAVRVKIGN